MTQTLILGAWLEELAVYGTPRRFYDAETAHHLAQAISYWYLVKLAIAPPCTRHVPPFGDSSESGKSGRL